MVSQVFPNARRVVDDGYAHVLKVGGGSNAGEHQQVRRADCPGGQDYLVAVSGLQIAVHLVLDAGCSCAFEDDAVRQCAGCDGQVWAFARFAQIADVGAPADAVGVVERAGTRAGGVGIVVVGAVRKAVFAACLVPCLLVGQPFVGLVAPDDGRAVNAVEVVGEVGVRLHAVEKRDELLERPLVVAPRCPVVVVLRDAAQEYLRVDSGRAAGRLAARNEHRRRLIG